MENYLFIITLFGRLNLLRRFKFPSKANHLIKCFTVFIRKIVIWESHYFSFYVMHYYIICENETSFTNILNDRQNMAAIKHHQLVN